MRLFLLFFSFLLFACAKESSENPLEKALSSEHLKIKRVMDNLEKHEVQILFTEVDRDSSGSPYFTDYEFQVDDSVYFYPASTVKFPIAVLALEKIGKEVRFNKDSKFYVEGDSIETTFSKEVMKIFAVSDNEANNRLFEYLGKDAINSKLASKGIPARISHRLSTPNSGELTTKPLIFYLNDTALATTEELINSPIKPLRLEKINKGVGHIKEDSLINESMDFSLKNYISIYSLHEMMKRIIFPDKYTAGERFDLTAADREFLLKAMKILPKEAGYDPNEYYDGYVKFLLYGDTKDTIPEHIEIYNKVGYAYGYLTDCAYIKNTKTTKEYIISATVHVNENQIFNDGVYEYDEIGLPFLAELGRQLVLKEKDK
ncbi:MAG: serine hydrolase [Flavobacteriaceae bacterium]|nr:serine hydrolase [Flavobacteriaceae bacterium]